MRLDLRTTRELLIAGLDPETVARVLTAAGWSLPDSEGPFPQWLQRLDLDAGVADHERIRALALYRFLQRHQSATRERLAGAAELVAFLATGWSSAEPTDLEHATTIERAVTEATASGIVDIAGPELTALVVRLIEELYFNDNPRG